MRPTFHGAAGEVTGSCLHVRAGLASFLVDCGMFQGALRSPQNAAARNRANYTRDLGPLDFVLATHAHIDHCGLPPRFAAAGPRQPHLDAGSADHRRARHADPQDLEPRDRPARRHRRHDGGASRGRTAVRADARDRARASRLPRLGRARGAVAGRRRAVSVSRPLALDSPGQMVASILSKKIAAGSTHLVLDIPLGPGAKVRHGDDAPIARDILDSGRALARFEAIVEAQGRKPFERAAPPLAPFVFAVTAEADGVVSAIDNERLACIARLAGAPKVAGAGVDPPYKIGATVARGAPPYRIHAASRAELDFARRPAESASGYTFDAAATTVDRLLDFRCCCTSKKNTRSPSASARRPG